MRFFLKTKISWQLLVILYITTFFILSHPQVGMTQFSDPLSGMQFDSMALANMSLMLSLSQREVFYRSVPLRLSGNRQTSEQQKQESATGANLATDTSPKTESEIENRSSAPRDFTGTDFTPQRQQSIAEQFSSLATNNEQRSQLLTLGQTIFNEVEQSPEFRKNNLTYAVALAMGAAISIKRGTELTDAESDFLLDAVHQLLTADPQLMQRPAAELTALYDTCLLFAGLMTTFHVDAVQNGNQDCERAAQRLAAVTFKAMGWPEEQ